MPNPVVTLRLATVYDQLVISRILRPPLGFKPFKPKIRRAFYSTLPGIKDRFKLDALICPACGAPKNENDDWGMVWIIGHDDSVMEPGCIQECRVCWCQIWSETMFLANRTTSPLFFRSMPKGIRHEPAHHSPANGSI
jgi:hypothetical protein